MVHMPISVLRHGPRREPPPRLTRPPRDREEDRVAQLESRVAELEALLDGIPVALFITDEPQSGRVWTNKRGAELVGQGPYIDPPGTAGGAKRMLDGREAPAAALPLQRSARTGEPVADVREVIVSTRGEASEVLVSAVPILDQNGLPIGAVAAAIEVSRFAKLGRPVDGAGQDVAPSSSAEAARANLRREGYEVLSADELQDLARWPTGFDAGG
jgi:PAS domain-containing protein